MAGIDTAVTWSLRIAKRDANSIPTRPTARRTESVDCLDVGCAGAFVTGTGAGADDCSTVGVSVSVVEELPVLIGVPLLLTFDRVSKDPGRRSYEERRSSTIYNGVLPVHAFGRTSLKYCGASRRSNIPYCRMMRILRLRKTSAASAALRSNTTAAAWSRHVTTAITSPGVISASNTSQETRPGALVSTPSDFATTSAPLCLTQSGENFPSCSVT